MSTRELHKGIDNLKNYVLEMGAHAQKMVEGGMQALQEMNLDLARNVDKKKHKLREYDDRIEDEAFKLIALYSPMAIDLRRVTACLKINSYLYRIGRYGKVIAKIVKEIKNQPQVKLLVNIHHIFEHSNEMVSRALQAFHTEDTGLIYDFSARDDEVDDLRWAIFRECITYMMENPKYITVCSHYIMIARYYERIGDNACKIAEKTNYMVTGEWKDFS